jgi:hypothetical protein
MGNNGACADVAQLVERRLPKPKVAGSTPVVRLPRNPATARFPASGPRISGPQSRQVAT